MKPKYPKILPWLAKEAGVPAAKAEALWVEALCDATRECAVVESPEYWQSAVSHLRARLATESLLRRAAPFGWGYVIRLPGNQWLHSMVTAEAMFMIGIRTASSFQQRSCYC